MTTSPTTKIITIENPAAEFRKAFSLNGTDHNLHAVRYWTLDDFDPNGNALVLGVRADDLDPEILAGTIFYRPNEENQAEIFAHIAAIYSDDQASRGLHWAVQDLIGYIANTNDAALGTFLYGNSGTRPNKSTMDAVRRKMRLPGRVPSFIDPQPQANVMGTSRQTGNIDDLFIRPGLNVIRVSESTTAATHCS